MEKNKKRNFVEWAMHYRQIVILVVRNGRCTTARSSSWW